MHPGRTASVVVNGDNIGYLGEVHPAVAKNYGIGTRAYLAVLDMEKVVEYAKMRNPKLEIFPISAKTGEGVDAWCDWLKKNVAQWNQE